MLDIEYVKSAANQNIERVLDELGLEYRWENGWVVLPCPFHNGEDDNFKFRGSGFYCFSQCQEHYDVIDLVMKINHMYFGEALQWIGNLFGIEDDGNPHRIEKSVDNRAVINSLFKAKKRNEVVYIPIEQQILNTVEPFYHPWMAEAGFTEQTCQHFEVGYARYGTLDGRVCFLIRSPDGRIISISGRMPNYERYGCSKYYIVGHTQVKNTLFNLSSVLDDLWLYEYIIVVEGFKSVLWLYQNGYENAVAAIGASLSDEQRNLLLKTGLPIVVICDNDRVGECFGQAVYNKCYQFTEVTQIKLSEITQIEKASVDDLTDREFNILRRKLNEI